MKMNIVSLFTTVLVIIIISSDGKVKWVIINKVVREQKPA